MSNQESAPRGSSVSDRRVRPRRSANTGASPTEHSASSSENGERDGPFDNLEQALPVAIHTVGPDGCLLDVNDYELKTLGFSRDELIGQSLESLYIAHRDAEAILTLLRDNAAIETLRATVRCRDGSTKSFAVSCQRLVDDQGQATVRCCSIEIPEAVNQLDSAEANEAISDRSLAATDSSQVSCEHLQSVLDTATEFIMSLDLNGTIQYINRVVPGMKKDEVIGSCGFDYVTPDHRERLQTAMAKVRESQQPVHYESEAAGAFGTTAWYSCHLGPVLSGGEVVGFTLCTSDVTKQREGAAELRLMQHSIETCHVPIFWIRSSGRFEYTNQAATVSLGFSREEFAKLSVTDIDPLATSDNWNDIWNRMKKAGSMTFETRQRRKDGQTIPVLVSANYFRYENDEYVFAITQDISEKKKARQQLQLTRFAVDSAAEAIFTIDPTGHFVDVNQMACERLGYSRDELVGMTVADINPEYTIEQWPAHWEVLKSKGRRLMETFHESRTGHVFPVEISTSYFEFEGNEYACTFARDISERRLAERALQESEAKLRSLFDNVPAYIFSVDREGRILFINQTLEGITKEQAIGTPVFQFLPPDSNDLVRHAVLQVFETGQPQQYEISGPGHNGSEAWYSCRLAPITHEDKIVAAIYISTDITELKAMQARLTESEAKYRALAEESPAMVGIFQGRRILYANPALQAATECSESELSEIGFPDLVHPADREMVLSRSTKRQQGEEIPPNYQFRYLTKSGRTRWMDFSGVRINFMGQPAVLGLGVDITERKSTEEQLRQKAAELAHMARVSTMGEMVAGIAHEINQPLSAISTYAGACANVIQQSDQEFRLPLEQWLKDIGSQAVRCGDIIRRLRNYVRKVDSERRLVCVNTIINESIALVHSDLKYRWAEIDSELVEPSPVVLGDEVELQQVIVNLLLNACEAVEGRVEAARTNIRTRVVDGRVQVEVQDRGLGIEPEHLEKMFDAFFTTKPDGLGMGLAISRSIIEDHNGRLWAESQLGKGSTLKIELPIAEGPRHE